MTRLAPDRLRALLLVHRLGSIAAAARQLDVTPSAVSQQLALLEREVGGDVTVRRGRSIELTALGMLLADAGGRVEAELERTAALVEHALGAVAGTFAVATVPSAGLHIVSEAVGALGRSDPGIDITVTGLEAVESVERLVAGAVDLALVDRYDGVPWAVPDGIVQRRLGREPLVVLASRQLGVGESGTVGLGRLADLPWVLAPADVACGAAARLVCRHAGFEPQVRWETDDLLLLREYVAAGLGVTLLPRLAVASPPPGTEVLVTAGRPARREIVALGRATTADRPAQRAVLAALVTAARDHLEAAPRARSPR